MKMDQTMLSIPSYVNIGLCCQFQFDQSFQKIIHRCHTHTITLVFNIRTQMYCYLPHLHISNPNVQKLPTSFLPPPPPP